jgi:hypothetical protein
MSKYSPTDSIRVLNCDEGMFRQDYNICGSEKKIGDRRQDTITIGNLMQND